MWRPTHLELPFLGDVGNQFSLGINLSNLGPKIYYIDKAQADPIPTNLRVGVAARIFEDEYNSLTYTIDFCRLLVGVITDSSNQRPDFYKAVFSSWGDRPFSDLMKSINTAMGLEYWYGVPQDFMFALRAGFFYEDPSYGNRKFITLGAGIRYDIYGFDFSYLTTDIFKNVEFSPLNNTLRFSLSIAWGEQGKKSLGFPRGI
jgi:hypothetical protein